LTWCYDCGLTWCPPID